MKTDSAAAVAELEKHVDRIKSGKEKVRPGMPFILNEAASVGDGVWQGDLALEVVVAVPDGYVKAKKLAANKQLVPGNTVGAKHCLESLDGVDLWHPVDWPNAENLIGPCIVAKKECRVLHPTHGAITIAAGHTILCSYQREYDAEQRRVRRNAD